MSMFEDYIDFMDLQYGRCEEFTPHVDDLIWIDSKGNSHDIETMDIDYVVSVLHFLKKKGFKKEEMPKALFKRWANRHKVVANEFKDLG